jgi:hypothetical protein
VRVAVGVDADDFQVLGMDPASRCASSRSWPTPATRLGHHPRRRVRRDDGRSGAGRRPTLTLADRLLATVLHHRLALPQVAVAALFSVRPETINRRIRDTRDLLDQAGHTIEPTQQPLATLDDLYDLARTASITTPTRTTTAS